MEKVKVLQINCMTVKLTKTLHFSLYLFINASLSYCLTDLIIAVIASLYAEQPFICELNPSLIVFIIICLAQSLFFFPFT